MRIYKIEIDGETDIDFIFFKNEGNGKFNPVYEVTFDGDGKNDDKRINIPNNAFKQIATKLSKKMIKLGASTSFPIIENEVDNDSEYLFNLQPNGKFLTKEGKDYVVFDYPNAKKETIFKSLVKAIKASYVNAQYTTSLDTVENELVTINSQSQGLKYKINIYVKDEKIKVEAPFVYDISEAYTFYSDFQGYIKNVVFKENGEPKEFTILNNFNKGTNFDLYWIVTNGLSFVEEEDW